MPNSRTAATKKVKPSRRAWASSCQDGNADITSQTGGSKLFLAVGITSKAAAALVVVGRAGLKIFKKVVLGFDPGAVPLYNSGIWPVYKLPPWSIGNEGCCCFPLLFR